MKINDLLLKLLPLAPDDLTAERALALSSYQNWNQLKGTPSVIWGETPASTKNKYRSAVQLIPNRQFYCSCPSRKKPCKHSLGLWALYLSQPDAFIPSTQIPEHIAQWQKAGSPSKTASQQLSVEERWEKNRLARLPAMKQGMADFERWLLDVFRVGLQPYLKSANHPHFEEMARRLVDSKLGTLARQVRVLASEPPEPGALIQHLTQWYILAKAFRRIERLPSNLQDDLLQRGGLSFKKEDLFALTPVTDHWLLLSVSKGTIENLRFQRRWWYGLASQRFALEIEYLFGDGAFPGEKKTGALNSANAYYYPGVFAHRAVFRDRGAGPAPPLVLNGFDALDRFAEHYRKAIKQQVWLENFPVLLLDAIPHYRQEEFFLVMTDKKMVPLRNIALENWTLLSVSGGQGIDVFGEWDGEKLLALAAIVEGQIIDLKAPVKEG